MRCVIGFKGGHHIFMEVRSHAEFLEQIVSFGGASFHINDEAGVLLRVSEVAYVMPAENQPNQGPASTLSNAA